MQDDLFASTDIPGKRILSDSEQSIVDQAMEILNKAHAPGSELGSPDATRKYLCGRLADYKNEVFGVIYLDNLCRIITIDEMFNGSVAQAAVHPRVVVQRALEVNAAAVVYFHNHPSGVAEAIPCR